MSEHTDEAMSGTALASMRVTVIAGAAIVALFIGGFGGWAVLAPLESAAVAPGVVSVESNRKTIQHLEGGIVSHINVREGQAVARGEVLLELDATRSKAELRQLEGRLHAALARAARLAAERDGADVIEFPPAVIESPTPSMRTAVVGERRIFQARRQTRAAQRAVVKQRIARLEDEISGLQGQIVSEDRQLALIGREIRSERTLVERKLTGMQRLLELERDEAEIAGNRSRNVASIARTRQSIGEERLSLTERDSRQVDEVVAQLRETETLIADLRERLRSAGDVATRTRIVAPLDGVVVNLKVHTVGGVVAPGEPLMEVVPEGESLVVHARVSTDDIDSVHVGLQAQTHITAFNRRYVLAVDGRVLSVSADRLTDERTGLPYFLAVVGLPDRPYGNDDSLAMYPGMQAEVMIITGRQSPMDYLVQPVIQSFNRALREN